MKHKLHLLFICVCIGILFVTKTLDRFETRNKSKKQARIVLVYRDNSTKKVGSNGRIMHYPNNGTGKSVDVSRDFDPSVFNSFCDTDANLTAVIPIYSTVGSLKTRRRLRSSLGKWAKQLNCKVFFIVGVSLSKSINAMLQDEYVREEDILVVGKIDTYRDLNNKAFAMIEWISKYCSHVPYVIHTIDDSYINLQWFLQRLQGIEQLFYMLAPVPDNLAVVRDHPKSSVTVEEYPLSMFPPYAYGFAYAFPSRVAARLLSAVYNATYCWIEDVWIGGHVRIAAGVDLSPIPRKQWELSRFKTRNYMLPVAPADVAVMHSVQPNLLFRFYINSLTGT